MTSESERLRRSWIANADAWSAAVRERRIESRRAVTDAAIVDAVLEQNPRRLLDVGCGEGWLARALSAQGIEVTGIDASPPLIDAARALGGGTFHVMSYDGDMTQLGSFDLAVANFSLLDDRTEDVLRALPAPRVILQTIHPRMAGGGYVDGWRTETFDAMPGEWRESMPWYFRTVESWKRAIENGGYKIAETREPMYPDRDVPASLMFICWRRS